ncbi:MAG TPA: DUF169 domain-containing protein [Syntrophorhabdaceae bacterium]|nr:DUF169 domain-containing protein [Syntrophorhabdaceae bacterium]
MPDQERSILEETALDLYCVLNLKQKIVGVKFLFDAQEFAKAKARPLKRKMAYCVMVRSALTGKSLKATTENFGCMGGARALGAIDLDETSLSGRFYNRLGLYQDLSTSKNVQQTMTFCQHKLYGVMVKPLEEYNDEPDVVLTVTTPYNAMRVIQAYTHVSGYKTSFKIAGNQAICSECTAYPFESNDINVSLLCSGTRYKAGWGDDEMAVGFPFNLLFSIVKGLYATLDMVEPDEKKAEIESRCSESGRKAPAIHYGKNYYTGLNPP